ncbi:hypothetical protein ES703_94675 [subsurface metagenome]
MEKIVSLNLILRLRWNAVGLERNLFIKYLYKNTNHYNLKKTIRRFQNSKNESYKRLFRTEKV